MERREEKKGENRKSAEMTSDKVEKPTQNQSRSATRKIVLMVHSFLRQRISEPFFGMCEKGKRQEKRRRRRRLNGPGYDSNKQKGRLKEVVQIWKSKRRRGAWGGAWGGASGEELKGC